MIIKGEHRKAYGVYNNTQVVEIYTDISSSFISKS